MRDGAEDHMAKGRVIPEIPARTCETDGHIYNSSGCVFCRAIRCTFMPHGTSARCRLEHGHQGDHEPTYGIKR